MSIATLFLRKSKLAQESGGHYYGDGGTIHGSTALDVEIDPDGEVCAIWFRCRTLPFKTFRRPDSCYDNPDIEIRGIEWHERHL